jgi:hypothetical protein
LFIISRERGKKGRGRKGREKLKKKLNIMDKV